jgi:hypothetical protein
VINIDVEFEEYYTYDEPIPINGLFLYPIPMRQYIYFHKNIGCFLINKNRIPDPRYISMSYLEFIFVISNEKNDMLLKLDNLLYLCFNLDRNRFYIDYDQDEKGKPLFFIKEYKVNLDNEDEWIILNVWKFTHKDFKLIREIICEQNAIEMPDEKIDPKLEKAFLEAQEFQNKQNGNLKIVSLENQMISTMINAHLDLDKILKLSIRKFIKILSIYDKELHYRIYKQASMSGFVEFKKPIVHYLYDSKEDKYDHLITDYEEFQDKVSKVAKTK